MDTNATKYGEGTELVWKDRKRWMGMPLSFTRYHLVRKPGAWFKVFSDVGLLYSVIEEVNLYRIFDVSMTQSFLGKIVNTGTVILHSNDERNPVFVMKNIKNPFKVRDMFSNYIEQQRKVHNVKINEYYS